MYIIIDVESLLARIVMFLLGLAGLAVSCSVIFAVIYYLHAH